MPANDRYYRAVRNALEKDGWIITHDPLRLTVGLKTLFVDLGAERLLAAQKDTEFIAVEIKTFFNASEMVDLERAVGQYVIYKTLLADTEPYRVLYLAVPQGVIEDLFREPIGQVLIREGLLRVVGFEPQTETLTEWLQ